MKSPPLITPTIPRNVSGLWNSSNRSDSIQRQRLCSIGSRQTTKRATRKTPHGIKRWGDEVTATNYLHNPDKRGGFVEQLKPLGLDPKTTTLFDWLEADDKASHAQKAA